MLLRLPARTVVFGVCVSYEYALGTLNQQVQFDFGTWQSPRSRLVLICLLKQTDLTLLAASAIPRSRAKTENSGRDEPDSSDKEEDNGPQNDSAAYQLACISSTCGGQRQLSTIMI